MKRTQRQLAGDGGRSGDRCSHGHTHHAVTPTTCHCPWLLKPRLVLCVSQGQGRLLGAINTKQLQSTLEVTVKEEEGGRGPSSSSGLLPAPGNSP